MKVSYNWLQKYFNDRLPDVVKLTDLFTEHTFEVEDLEKKGTDMIFEAKVLPDRAPYLLSHKGVAREASVITGLPFNNNISEKIDLPLGKESGIGVMVEDDNKCRRYSALSINQVTVSTSPDWLKSALEGIGQKSINSVVDVANYVMFDVGQPLHTFDADKIVGNICVRQATVEEKIVLLTGEEVTLSADDLVIADEAGPIAIAGVKGGKRTGVTLETKKLILEAANFDPVSVRKTATRLNLRNDAAKRFENGLTPALTAIGLEKFFQLLKELCPEIEIGGLTDIYLRPVLSWPVKVNADEISALIGLTVSQEKIGTILTALGCSVEVVTDNLVITPPLERVDIVNVKDVADEVGRLIGYEKIPAVLPPTISDISFPDKTFFYAEKIKNILMKLDYSEVLLYSLVTKGFFTITYPLASDKVALRESLTPKLIEALISNGRNADLLNLEVVKICEIGKVFTSTSETTNLALGVSVIKKKKGLSAEAVLESDIKLLMETIGQNLTYEITKGDFGAVAEIDLSASLASFPPAQELTELKFQALPKDIKYKKFSVYPYIVRDIAVFVPDITNEEEIKELIDENAGPLCLQSRLFDVFLKETPTGKKKSCAFRLIFQSFERTLEDVEISALMDKIYQKIATKDGWEIR